MTVLFCVVKTVGTYCFGNPSGFGGGPVAWYVVSLSAALLLVLSSLVKPWGVHIDSNQHIFVFIEAIKLAALFFLILTPEQVAGYQCVSPASLGQIIGQSCTPGSSVASIGLQCDPAWYAGAGFNLTAQQLSDLASVCGVPDFLIGYFVILAAEITTMAYLFIVHDCIFPKRGMRFGFGVLVGHLVLVGINCIMWGVYELFIYVTYSGGLCKLPLAGNGIALRAFCTLYMFVFTLILIVLIHRIRTKDDPIPPSPRSARQPCHCSSGSKSTNSANINRNGTSAQQRAVATTQNNFDIEEE